MAINRPGAIDPAARSARSAAEDGGRRLSCLARNAAAGGGGRKPAIAVAEGGRGPWSRTPRPDQAERGRIGRPAKRHGETRNGQEETGAEHDVPRFRRGGQPLTAHGIASSPSSPGQQRGPEQVMFDPGVSDARLVAKPARARPHAYAPISSTRITPPSRSPAGLSDRLRLRTAERATFGGSPPGRSAPHERSPTGDGQQTSSVGGNPRGAGALATANGLDQDAGGLAWKKGATVDYRGGWDDATMTRKGRGRDRRRCPPASTPGARVADGRRRLTGPGGRRDHLQGCLAADVKLDRRIAAAPAPGARGIAHEKTRPANRGGQRRWVETRQNGISSSKSGLKPVWSPAPGCRSSLVRTPASFSIR